MGLALVAIGAILLLAVNVRLTFLSFRLTGLILILTGLAGLRFPQWVWRWLCGHEHALKEALDRFAEPPDRFTELPSDSTRVPLEDMLRPEATAGTQASRRG